MKKKVTVLAMVVVLALSMVGCSFRETVTNVVKDELEENGIEIEGEEEETQETSDNEEEESNADDLSDKELEGSNILQSDTCYVIVPDDWVTSNVSGVAMATSVDGNYNVNIIEEDISGSGVTNVDEYATYAEQSIEECGVTIKDSKDSKLEGNDAWVVEYYMEDIGCEGYQLYYVYGYNAYVVTVTSYGGEDEELFESIAGSFKIGIMTTETNVENESEEVGQATIETSETSETSGEITEWYQFNLEGKFFELPVQFSADMFDGTGIYFKDGYENEVDLSAGNYTSITMYKDEGNIGRDVGCIYVYSESGTTDINSCTVIGISINNSEALSSVEAYGGIGFNSTLEDMDNLLSDSMELKYSGDNSRKYTDSNASNAFDNFALSTYDGEVTRIEIKHSGL